MKKKKDLDVDLSTNCGLKVLFNKISAERSLNWLI